MSYFQFWGNRTVCKVYLHENGYEQAQTVIPTASSSSNKADFIAFQRCREKVSNFLSNIRSMGKSVAQLLYCCHCYPTTAACHPQKETSSTIWNLNDSSRHVQNNLIYISTQDDGDNQITQPTEGTSKEEKSTEAAATYLSFNNESPQRPVSPDANEAVSGSKVSGKAVDAQLVEDVHNAKHIRGESRSDILQNEDLPTSSYVSPLSTIKPPPWVDHYCHRSEENMCMAANEGTEATTCKISVFSLIQEEKTPSFSDFDCDDRDDVGNILLASENGNVTATINVSTCQLEETSTMPIRTSAISMMHSATKKCHAVFLGGAYDTIGYCSLLNPKVCSSLRCTECNFLVLRFIGKRWDEKESDYLFFRNCMPDETKLARKHINASDFAAYCCQCSFISVNNLVKVGLMHNTKIGNGFSSHLKWVCAGHT